MNRNPRGVTLIETCFALAILVTVIVAACMVIRGSYRHSAMQWEELTAREFADSVLEHVMSENTCALTAENGRKLGADAGDPTPPPGFDAMLFVAKNANDDKLVDVRVAVTWQRELAQGLDADARIERKLRRRAQR